MDSCVKSRFRQPLEANWCSGLECNSASKMNPFCAPPRECQLRKKCGRQCGAHAACSGASSLMRGCSISRPPRACTNARLAPSRVSVGGNRHLRDSTVPRLTHRMKQWMYRRWLSASLSPTPNCGRSPPLNSDRNSLTPFLAWLIILWEQLTRCHHHRTAFDIYPLSRSGRPAAGSQPPTHALSPGPAS